MAAYVDKTVTGRIQPGESPIRGDERDPVDDRTPGGPIVPAYPRLLGDRPGPATRSVILHVYTRERPLLSPTPPRSSPNPFPVIPHVRALFSSLPLFPRLPPTYRFFSLFLARVYLRPSFSRARKIAASYCACARKIAARYCACARRRAHFEPGFRNVCPRARTRHGNSRNVYGSCALFYLLTRRISPSSHFSLFFFFFFLFFPMLRCICFVPEELIEVEYFYLLK